MVELKELRFLKLKKKLTSDSPCGQESREFYNQNANKVLMCWLYDDGNCAIGVWFTANRLDGRRYGYFYSGWTKKEIKECFSPATDKKGIEILKERLMLEQL